MSTPVEKLQAVIADLLQWEAVLNRFHTLGLYTDNKEARAEILSKAQSVLEETSSSLNSIQG